LTRKKVEPTSETISQEEVFNVLQFATSAYNGAFQGVYSPFLTNQRLQDASLNPQIATSTKIERALLNPKQSEQELIGYSEFLEFQSMLYKRMLLYMSTLMSFDWTYVCTNAELEDYTNPAYIKDLKILKNFTDKFDIKGNFGTALKQMLRNEVFFGILRMDDAEKYIIQELPQNYCILVGRSGPSLLFDFNLYYFLMPSVSLDMYPPIFTEYAQETLWKNGGKYEPYNPAATLDARTGTWVLWHQTSPRDGFVAFKVFPEIATRIPFLSPLMPTAVLEPVIRGLQTNSYIQQASKLLYAEIPMLKETQAKLKDQVAISPDTAGKFMALMQAALPAAIKLATTPLANAKAMEFTGSDTIYNSYLQTMAASSGTNSRLLYSIDRQNILETKLSMDIDQNVLKPVYNQFSDFLNYTINRLTKKYKFKITFEGFETSTNREERFNNVMKLSESGIILEQKFAAAIGMNPFDFRRQLEETRANGFVKKLTPILKSSQMAGGANGRPAQSDTSLGDSGAESRASGSNDEKDEE
jgi:hypothetical protein